MTWCTLFAADFVLHDPSPVAKTIAAVLSHLTLTTDVGKHKDSLRVRIYSANTSVLASAWTSLSAVLMVESEADQLSEDEMLGAVVFGHEQMQAAIDELIMSDF